jgi:TrmH family RNA methyltransferase
MLTSRANPRLKAFAALHRRKEREATGLTLAEGPHLAAEALAGEGPLEALLLGESALAHPETADLRAAAEARGVGIVEMTDGCYARVSGLQSPEGVAVVLPWRRLGPADVLSGTDVACVAIQGVQDPGNAGAVVRVAEAAGATACLFLGGVDPSHPRLLRGAMGSAFRLPCASGETPEVLRILAEGGIRLLAAAPGGTAGAQSYDAASYERPLVLALGSEGGGLEAELLESASARVIIPMEPPVESLNVAVAAGILLYEARRAWTASAT